jgi:transposase InsO family protein
VQLDVESRHALVAVIVHLRTQPYRPRTNGKAGPFIQTLQREWAYAIAYEHSWQRRQALMPWLTSYDRRRPHSALGHKTPISQLTAD